MSLENWFCSDNKVESLLKYKYKCVLHVLYTEK